MLILAMKRSFPKALSVMVANIHSPCSGKKRIKMCMYSRAKMRFQQSELIKSTGFLPKLKSSQCKIPSLYFPVKLQ